jgi:hypothetical protein
MRINAHTYTAQGSVSIEIVREPSGWATLELSGPGKPLPSVVSDELDRTVLGGAVAEEIVLEFSATICHDPGRTYGPPEKCYPPEHAEERDVTEAVLWHKDYRQRKRLSPASIASLAEMFAKEIEAAGLDEE